VKAIGIIAEYNPFHSGHAAHFRLAVEACGERPIVCAVSGDFVQRGAPAVCRRHVRAAQAVKAGADLVLELPLPWAVAGAETFARGGVELLAATGIVDSLCFGSESADTAELEKTADILLSQEFSAALQEQLGMGDGFAAARQRAAEQLGVRKGLLNCPNDILGVEYIKAIKQGGYEIKPFAVKRLGAGHDCAPEGGYASAGFVRELLEKGEFDRAAQYLPCGGENGIFAELEAGRAPVREEDMSHAALAVLRQLKAEDIACLPDVSEGLENRLYRALRENGSLAAAVQAAGSRRYPTARIRRILMSGYLGITADMARRQVPYIRVLAFSGRGRELLRQMKTSASLEVITKPADAAQLSGFAGRVFAAEQEAADKYALCFKNEGDRAAGSLLRRSPEFIED